MKYPRNFKYKKKYSEDNHRVIITKKVRRIYIYEDDYKFVYEKAKEIQKESPNYKINIPFALNMLLKEMKK